jgi:hypothetical protein
MANNKSRVNPAKRHAQNVRTFMNVQKRRKKHALAHGMSPSDIKAKTWVSEPTSKK